MNKSYYAIIPANVRYDKRLTANAKLLYGEITALCNEKGYCWARNSYFAELYGVSKTSISKWISQLIEYGYIFSEIKYRDGSKEIENRYLKLVDIPINENAIPIEEKLKGYERKVNNPIEEKLNTPIEEKLKDNNTVINNTFNNINNNIIDEKSHPNDFTQGGKEQSVESEGTNALSVNNKNALSANNKKNISKSINERFEHLWKLLPSTKYDRKAQVKPKRKKELFEMGIERVEKAINLYLKIQDPKYYYRRDNFFNEIIDNYLDKTEKEFEIPIVPHQKEPSPAYNIDRYFETMEAIEAMDTFI